MDEKKKYRELWLGLTQVINEVEVWLVQEREGERAFLNLKTVDALRLFRLKTWSERHKVSIAEILDLVMPSLRDKVQIKKKTKGLGVSVATLVSKTGYGIFLSRLRKRYPNDEQIWIWYENQREMQLAAEQNEDSGGVQVRELQYASVLDAPSVSAYFKAYNRDIDRARATRDRAYSQKWRVRKNYRENPWR